MSDFRSILWMCSMVRATAAEVALADQGIRPPQRFRTSGVAPLAQEFVGEAIEVGTGRNCHAATVTDQILTEV
jgi:hypothetical protein